MLRKSNFFFLPAVALTATLAVSSCTSHDHATPTVAKLGVKNLSQPQPFIYSSGQPSKAQLENLAKAGVKHVVNLRPTNEQSWDEEKHVRSLGMNYVSIPISGVADLTKANAKKLDNAITIIGKDPALIHCASGNRVGALIAIREATIKGKSQSQAIAKGKRWGLTGLKPGVQTRLTEMGY